MVKWFMVGVICVLPMMCGAASHQEYFKTFLPVLTNKLQMFPGPLSAELAKVALGRQVLEDGISRNPNNSCAGISIGGFNKEMLHKAIDGANIKIGSASDGEGTFYYLQGDGANLYSAMAIAYLFDFYVYKFNKKHKILWERAKEVSKAAHQQPDSFELHHQFYCVLKPDKIIESANSLYGPQSAAVMNIVKTSTRE
jgi:hypothetical protein